MVIIRLRFVIIKKENGDIHIYIYTEEEAVGPAFWQPTMFSGFVCFERLCVGSVSVGRSFGAHACMFLFPTTTSALTCFKPGGLFINTGFVYKHALRYTVLSTF